MTGIYILLGIILLIMLFLSTKAGVRVAVVPGLTRLRVRFGVFSFGILPAKKKEVTPRQKRKAEKKKEKKALKKALKKAEKKKEKKKSIITPALVLDLVPCVFRAVARFFGGIDIERLYCHVVVATGDAANTAVLFGAAHAGLVVLTPLTAKASKSDITIALDYDLPSTQLYLSTALSIRVGTVLAIGFSLLFAFWRISRVGAKGRAA